MDFKFNPDEKVLTLSVMSDIHVSGSWGIERSEKFFKNALRYANDVAENNIDAYLFVGDFCDCMNSPANVFKGGEFPDDYEQAKAIQTKTEFEILRRCMSEEINENSEIIYCLGNHDSMSRNNTERFITEFSSLDTVGDNKKFERFYRTDTDLESLRRGMRHCVYKDYHFLCVDMEKDYTETVAFLKKNLDEIVAADPDRFIFVLFHCKAPDTIYSSNLWGDSEEIDALLKNYPQVVLLTGHSHVPLQNERSIMQKEYTSVECSCVSYLLETATKRAENITHKMEFQGSQGLLIELDKTGNMRITRLDYFNHTKIKEPWEIGRPCGNRSHLSHYTEGRRFEFSPPKFCENAQLQVSPTENGTFISFAQAHHDDMVYRYEIKITDFNGKTELFYISSLFCFSKSLDDMPRSVSATLPFEFKNIYTLSVTPQDVWFNSGKALVRYL